VCTESVLWWVEGMLPWLTQATRTAVVMERGGTDTLQSQCAPGQVEGHVTVLGRDQDCGVVCVLGID
jgi:hypothetical protein